MELPIAVFDRITGHTGPITGPGEAEHERRQYRRLPFGTRAAMSPMRNGDEGPPAIVLLRDISLGGIGFLNAEPIKQGDEVVLRFKDQKGRPVKLRCAVQRCDSGGTGGAQFVIGASFEQLLEPAADALDEPEISAQQQASAPASSAAPLAGAAGRSNLFSRPAASVNPAPAAATPASEKGNVFSRPEASSPVAPGADATAAGSADAHSVAGTQSMNAPSTPPSEPAAAPAAQAPAPATPEADVLSAEAPVDSPHAEPSPQAAPLQSEPTAAVASSLEAAPREEKHMTTAASSDAASQNVPTGNHHQVVAKVRAKLLGQNQALQSQGKQLDETRRHMAEITNDRDQLRSALDNAQSETARQQAQNAQRIASLETELTAARHTIQLLQAKSDDDDKAIAELVALLEGAPEVGAGTTQEVAMK